MKKYEKVAEDNKLRELEWKNKVLTKELKSKKVDFDYDSVDAKVLEFKKKELEKKNLELMKLK